MTKVILASTRPVTAPGRLVQWVARDKMSSVWGQATDWEYPQSCNPAKGIQVADDGAGRRRNTRALTLDEIRRLLAAADACHWTDLQQMIRIGIFCGLRIGEILALRWSDVQGGVLRVVRSQSQGCRTMVAPKSRAGWRVSYATRMDSAGASLRESMGHGTEQMSQSYVTRTMADTAAAQDRIAVLIIGEQLSVRQ